MLLTALIVVLIIVAFLALTMWAASLTTSAWTEEDWAVVYEHEFEIGRANDEYMKES